MKQIPVNSLPKGDHELKVLSLGQFTPYDFQKAHRHSYFEFFIFEKGGGLHFIDFVEYPIHDYAVHIVFPQQIHLVRRSETSSGSIIICSKHFMNLIGQFFYPQLVQNNYTAPCLQFGVKEFNAIKQIAAHLQEEMKTDNILSYNLVQNYTSILLTHCIRHTAGKLTEEVQNQNYSVHEWEVYKRFSELLEAHFLEKPSVAFYAAELAMTPKVLNKCIRKVVGKTAVALLQEKTLMEAKRLLLNTEEHIKEIAYKLNFKDSSYFTRFFARQEAMTPKEFKTFWEQKYHS